ncbi:MAG: hypothetical protein ACD_37C00168G0001 [uncultured bacterium]|nr:MAG: hypothetical protein ACD_37C00168G0001 [uncultured bacterium]KKQ01236.1 MAG: hypothetical protein US07_C0001G0019 [Candidatus Levybacteria bacterium GW2011_GWB1_36_18]KKR17980.1 MAG: hypothetical protein UT44_C0001G0020 [Candidatus Levybacteria bacterium GW2011_GWA1_39_32]KKR51588.1 MAG: hypothetical protein UT87_C0003G0010 [Candidatus Levybacteria bacterium GW2011_GWC1_40_19]KKR73774.1 MAG: hypothetical protein UU15_C0002G0018 [Candidatus Levybacteria bacterium GW2011_GWC2_40_7]KKR952
MNKKTVNTLALYSFKKNNLDLAKFKRISRVLKKSDLRTYLKALKRLIDKQTVYISIPENNEIKAFVQKTFSVIYPEKKIEITIDSTLLAGVKIRNYDNIYELSLKDLLENNLRKIADYDK